MRDLGLLIVLMDLVKIKSAIHHHIVFRLQFLNYVDVMQHVALAIVM